MRSFPHLQVLEGRCLPSTVTNLNDPGPGSLRQAILDTPSGGTVDFRPGLSGTIALTFGELLLNKDLTIAGPGADVITVSGNHNCRVFEISRTFTVVISGLTIADGSVRGETGGGILNFGVLTVTDSILSGNQALPSFGGEANGGAIQNYGTLTFTRSTLTDSYAAQWGGGIFGGGTLTITDSTITRNLAGSQGGGIFSGGPLTITNSTVSANSTHTGPGGGIYNVGSLTITNSTITGNSANANGSSYPSGGGIFNHYNALSLTITNSTISNNAANGYGAQGGGIESDGPLTITSSTVSSNAATALSGGIDTGGGARPHLIRNTLVAGNFAPGSPDLLGSLDSQGHNLIGDGTGGSGYDPTDLVGTASNPIDPKLSPLQDNGGPTLTMALLPGSPAIDAGDNTGAPMWDQRGAPFRRIVNGIIDIGAFEVQARGHGGPTHQPLLDPVPIQVLGTPAGALFGQPPALPADSSPLPGPGARGAGQPGTDPVPTAEGQLAADAFFTADAVNGQPGDSLGPLDGIPVELPSMRLSG